MVQVRICFLIFLMLSFLPSPQTVHGSSDLEVRYDHQEEIDHEQRKWNSHIDNQAYLRNRAEQRRNKLYGDSGINRNIIINRNNTSNGCYYGDCRSWGVRYETGTSSFTYQEGYQPTRIYPVIIVPQSKREHPRYYRDKKLYHKRNHK